MLGVCGVKVDRTAFPGISLRTQWVAFAATLAVCLALLGCGGTSRSGTNTPIISTTLSQSPPSSLLLGQMATLAATVDNDVANAGVNWTVSCPPPGVCGSVSPTHTSSGAPTTFVAPLVNEVVTIKAFSTTDSSKTAVAVVTVASVSFSQAPPQSLTINGMANVVASLPTDPTGAGVDWTVTCGSAACGSFSPMHTASGTPTVYNAPAMMPTGAQVTVTATSTADAAATISQEITIVTSNITISLNSPFTNGSPPPIVLNNMALLSATVANDPLNAGVDWKVSCANKGAGACGSFIPTLLILDTLSNKTSSAAHTDNGAPVAYLAPSQGPGSAFAVFITAVSRTDNTVSANTMITVSAVTANGLLAGQFVFQISGRNANGGNQYVMQGSFVGDGNGNVVAGEADVIDSANPAAASGQASTALTGTYTIGADGRGQITLKTNGLSSFGLNGSITLSLAFVRQLLFPQDLANNPTPRNRALLSEIDGFGNGTGALYLQNLGDLALANSSETLLLLPPTSNLECLAGNFSMTSAACPPGLSLSGLATFFSTAPLTYILTLAGRHSSDASKPVFLAGGLTVGNAPSPSGMGQSMETSFVGDASDAGSLTANASSTTTPVIGGVPDNFGRLQLQGLDVGTPIFSSGSSSITTLNAYMVDRYHYVVLQAADANFTLAGNLTVFFDPILLNQGPPTLSGPVFAFTESGESGSAVPQVAGGILMCDPSGMQTSLLDVTPLNGPAIVNQPINVMCTDPGPNGRGSMALTGTTGNISQFAVYPTADEGGRNLQLIEVDSGGPSGAGVALPQTVSAPSATNNVLASVLSGNYAASFLADTPQGIEGFSGRIVSDGVSALSGTLDVNSLNVTANPLVATPLAGSAVSGSYAVPANSPGRFTLMLNIATPMPQAINPVCYIVDENTCLLLGLDTAAPGVGVLQLQNLGF